MAYAALILISYSSIGFWYIFAIIDGVDNSGVERQTIKSTYRNKSIKGLSDRRPQHVSDLFAAPDSKAK